MVTQVSKNKPVVPSLGENPEWVDERGVRFADTGEPYLTTHDLAKMYGMHPETVFRWCRRWFGNLPKGRAGAKMGYRIPLEYELVARAWLMTEDPQLREVVRRAIVTDPKDWVVVVANIGSTHYSDREVVGRVESLTSSPTYRHHALSIFHVGRITERG